MTIDLATLNNILAQHRPALTEALRAEGVPIAHIIISDEDESPYCFYGATKLDPVAPTAVLNDPIAKAAHNDRMREMIFRLLGHYRPDLLDSPYLSKATDGLIASINAKEGWGSDYDTYDRWDVIMSAIISALSVMKLAHTEVVARKKSKSGKRKH